MNNEFELLLIKNNVQSYGKPPKSLREIFPEGSMLFDVRYCTSPKEEFEVVYLDPTTEQLEVKYIPAIVDIYFLKNDCRHNIYQISQTTVDKCFRVWCKYSAISKMIYTYAGDAKTYNEEGSDLTDETYKEYYERYDGQLPKYVVNKKMVQNPWSFKADFQPDAYFRIRWVQEFGEDFDVSKITSGFLDIEVDTLDRRIDPKNPMDVAQPINAVTLILPKNKICSVFILAPRPKDSRFIHEKFWDLLDKQQKEYDWIINNQDEFKMMIMGKSSEDFPDCPTYVDVDNDNHQYLEGYDIRLHFFDFDKEIYLIKTIFDYINKYRPMFMFSWNAPFDDNYLLHRIEYLGYDPVSIIIPQEFETNRLAFVFDKTGNFNLKTNRDWFFTSTFTQYLCQMRLFAAVRKSQKEENSYALNEIGKKIAKIEKLTDTKSSKFSEFAYTDFIKFILYNIRDVVVQLAIESKVNDAQTLYGKSYSFCTSFSKCFQETHIVRNAKEYGFETFEGYIMSNKAVVDKTIDGAFEGAFVAEPKLNKPTGLVLSGRSMNNIIYGASDLDAAAMYPSHKMGYNLDKMSMLYKCRINNDVFRNGMCKNKSYNQQYIWYDSKNRPHEKDISGPIMNAFKNNNIMSLMENYFNVPDLTNMLISMKRQLSR